MNGFFPKIIGFDPSLSSLSACQGLSFWVAFPWKIPFPDREERSWADNTNLDKARALLWPIKEKPLGWMGPWLCWFRILLIKMVVPRGYNRLVGGLEHEFYFSIQLWISSSQLTYSIIFQRGRWLNHQPEGIFHGIWMEYGLIYPAVSSNIASCWISTLNGGNSFGKIIEEAMGGSSRMPSLMECNTIGLS